MRSAKNKKFFGKGGKVVTPKNSQRKNSKVLNQDYYINTQRSNNDLQPSHNIIDAFLKYSGKIKRQRRSKTQASEPRHASNATVKISEPYLRGVERTRARTINKNYQCSRLPEQK